MFAGEIGSTGELYVVAASGGTPTRITSDGADDAFPAWSPDSQQITFSSNRDGLTDDNYEIYSIGAGGGTPKRLTMMRLMMLPAWSPLRPSRSFRQRPNDQTTNLLMTPRRSAGATHHQPKDDIAPLVADGSKIASWSRLQSFHTHHQQRLSPMAKTRQPDELTNNPADAFARVATVVVANPPPSRLQPPCSSCALHGWRGDAKHHHVTRTAPSAPCVSTHHRCRSLKSTCERPSSDVLLLTPVVILRRRAAPSKNHHYPVADDNSSRHETSTVLLSNPSTLCWNATASVTTWWSGSSRHPEESIEMPTQSAGA